MRSSRVSSTDCCKPQSAHDDAVVTTALRYSLLSRTPPKTFQPALRNVSRDAAWQELYQQEMSIPADSRVFLFKAS